MDNNKIGNARQQDDNHIAVQNAKQLDCCWFELKTFFNTLDLQVGDYEPRQMALYQSLLSQMSYDSTIIHLNVPESPRSLDSYDLSDQDWLKRSIMSDKATMLLSAAIQNGRLPIWRINDAREVMITPQRLENDNIRYGLFKSNERPEPDMQGALLWVKIVDWEKYLTHWKSAVTPFSDAERERWIRTQPMTAADKAHSQYKLEPRFDGTKLAEFRSEWKNVRGTKRGRPPKTRGDNA